jgi:hypothetical protein
MWRNSLRKAGKASRGLGVPTVMKIQHWILWVGLMSIARITAALVVSREENG